MYNLPAIEELSLNPAGKDLGKEAVETGKDIGKEVIEKGKDIGGAATEALKGLLKPKKDEK